MTAWRRPLLLAALVALAPQGLHAQDYPARPIRIIVPYEYGGIIDPLTRILGEMLSTTLRERISVENRPGANGNDGIAEVAKSPADGYTLGMAGSGTLFVNPGLYAKMPFDAKRDLTQIVVYASLPNILVVNGALPVRTLPEFTAYTRAHPGELSYGSTGLGSSMYLAAELYKEHNRVYMLHLPFNSPGLATQSLADGKVDAIFQLVPGVLRQVRVGTLRPIGVLAGKRSSALPGIPTFAEQGMPIESAVWIVLVGPSGLPGNVVARLNAEVNRALGDPLLRDKLVELGVEPVGGTPEAAATLQAQEREKWGRLLQRLGARID
ncbi:MAG: tripartite tricarboxylate transporter substrate-binding protein [Betaproteobacteria bacterium]|nr:tripartite tricarboxylate transporter substrate-binding protein [Betaproteobacteria bacterium]